MKLIVLNTKVLDCESSTLTLKQKFSDDINSNVLLILTSLFDSGLHSSLHPYWQYRITNCKLSLKTVLHHPHNCFVLELRKI